MISGTISQNPTSCATPQDLEGLPDDALLNGEFAYVASLDKTYQLKRTSTSSPSGTTILSTFSGNGRWIEWTSGGGIGLSFPNYVDLRAYNIANTPDGTGVFVAGSASVGSGGEGVYYYDTGSLDVDDEGIVLKPDQIDGGDPGRWIRSYTGPIDARWFGATGDGNTDDYAAIAATFAACPDNGEVLLPEGTGYLISQQLRVDRPVSVQQLAPFLWGGPAAECDGIVFVGGAAGVQLEGVFWNGLVVRGPFGVWSAVGTAASIVTAGSAFATLTAGEWVDLAVDGEAVQRVTFTADDVTEDMVAFRVNVTFASDDFAAATDAGQVSLASSRVGTASQVSVVGASGGTLAKLGLSVGTTQGTGYQIVGVRAQNLRKSILSNVSIRGTHVGLHVRGEGTGYEFTAHTFTDLTNNRNDVLLNRDYSANNTVPLGWTNELTFGLGDWTNTQAIADHVWLRVDGLGANVSNIRFTSVAFQTSTGSLSSVRLGRATGCYWRDCRMESSDHVACALGVGAYSTASWTDGAPIDLSWEDATPDINGIPGVNTVRESVFLNAAEWVGNLFVYGFSKVIAPEPGLELRETESGDQNQLHLERESGLSFWQLLSTSGGSSWPIKIKVAGIEQLRVSLAQWLLGGGASEGGAFDQKWAEQCLASMTYAARTADSVPRVFTFTAQGAWAGASGANRDVQGFRWVVPSPAAGGVAGAHKFDVSGSERFRINKNGIAAGLSSDTLASLIGPYPPAIVAQHPDAAGENPIVAVQRGTNNTYFIVTNSAGSIVTGIGYVNGAFSAAWCPSGEFALSADGLNTRSVRVAGNYFWGLGGANPAATPVVTGSRGSGAALADLLTKLAVNGVIVNSTSA